MATVIPTLDSIKWAPTQDGKTCNACHEPVHYDAALHIHVHDDSNAASCSGRAVARPPIVRRTRWQSQNSQ